MSVALSIPNIIQQDSAFTRFACIKHSPEAGNAFPFQLIAEKKLTSPLSGLSSKASTIYRIVRPALCHDPSPKEKPIPRADQPERARSNLKPWRAEISSISTISVPCQNLHLRPVRWTGRSPKELCFDRNGKYFSFGQQPDSRYPPSKFFLRFVRRRAIRFFEFHQ